MSGWLDRVLVPGVAYRLGRGDGEPEPLLRLCYAVVINTTDTPAERERDVFGNSLGLIRERCVLPFCGSAVVKRIVIGPVSQSAKSQRSQWLQETTKATVAFCLQ